MAPSAVGPGRGSKAPQEGVHGLGAPEAGDEELSAGVIDLGSQAGVTVDVVGMGADEAVESRPDAVGVVIGCKPRLNSGHGPDRPVEHICP
jgi:hypothetical protein